jgi:uncharacterized protein (DUF952 family)
MTTIYHLVLESDWRDRARGASYTPARFEQDGFIHCAGNEETTLAVARSYFAQAKQPVLVVRIALDRLSSACRFEAPAPMPGGGEHRTPGKLFPHIYGPLNLDAITGVGRLIPRGDGFLWPAEFSVQVFPALP